MSETPTQSKFTMIRTNSSLRKYAANQKSETSTQEKQTNYPEINVVKHTVTTKEPGGLKNLGRPVTWIQFFSVLQKELHQ